MTESKLPGDAPVIQITGTGRVSGSRANSAAAPWEDTSGRLRPSTMSRGLSRLASCNPV
jgi:hypothetical protein